MTSYHVKLTGRIKQKVCVCICKGMLVYVTAIDCISVMPSITFSLSLCISAWHVEGVLKTKAVFKKPVGHQAAMIAIADV